MECRIGCGACCIAPSISSPIPGMPSGKPAGVRCMQLNTDNRCLLFGKPEKPVVCSNLRPLEEMCGQTFKEAHAYLEFLEQCTNPRLSIHEIQPVMIKDNEQNIISTHDENTEIVKKRC